MSDWKIFTGNGTPHDGLLTKKPSPPPWRLPRHAREFDQPPMDEAFLEAEAGRANPFLPGDDAILAVNAALYLRRPLLLTGKPGVGKSTLISKVAHELKLGPVLRWPITSRSTVKGGVYEYDAVGRLQSAGVGKVDPPVHEYLTLGPLGTALTATTWPRPLLIDEIDKSDLDLANDLLNILEEGTYEIPELRRLKAEKAEVNDWLGQRVEIVRGRIECGQFPFVVMTSNDEREFPAPFLRRCVRLAVEEPSRADLARIVESHLSHYLREEQQAEVAQVIHEFLDRRTEGQLATDQLLNAVFLTIGMNDGSARTFASREIERLRAHLWRTLTGA